MRAMNLLSSTSSGRRAAIAACVLFSVATLVGGRAAAQDTDEGWPRQITAPTNTIVIYQPQPDSLVGDVLWARAATSIQATGQTEPVFGALWFTAQIETDRDRRTATILNATVQNVRFPALSNEQTKQFTDDVERQVPEWKLTLSLDQLDASLAAARSERATDSTIQSDAPRIIFSETPAVLVTYDGAPELRPVENSGFQRVVNTPFFDRARVEWRAALLRQWTVVVHGERSSGTLAADCGSAGRREGLPPPGHQRRQQ